MIDPWESVEAHEESQRMLEFAEQLSKTEIREDGVEAENGSITRYIHIKHADSTVKIFRETTV